MKKGEEDVRIKEKIKELGRALGFEVEEEWTPEPLRNVNRKEVYIPRIDVVWYKKSEERFIKFLRAVGERMREKMGTHGNDLFQVLPKYRDIDKEIVICFELELSDRPTKYILGDIANLSRICDYGFIVIRNVENLVKRSIKATRAFSILHGASKVLIIDPDDIDELVEDVKMMPT